MSDAESIEVEAGNIAAVSENVRKKGSSIETYTMSRIC
jgi:hypothetical protein